MCIISQTDLVGCTILVRTVLCWNQWLDVTTSRYREALPAVECKNFIWPVSWWNQDLIYLSGHARLMQILLTYNDYPQKISPFTSETSARRVFLYGQAAFNFGLFVLGWIQSQLSENPLTLCPENRGKFTINQDGWTSSQHRISK